MQPSLNHRIVFMNGVHSFRKRASGTYIGAELDLIRRDGMVDMQDIDSRRI